MSAPPTLVVYRLGSLGDTVVALPCFHAVARAFPGHRRVVLTNAPVNRKAAPLEAVLGGSGLVHDTIAYPVGLRSPAALWALARRLRALHAGTLVYLTPARGVGAAWRDWLFFRLCGFRHIVGAPLAGDLQRHRRGHDGRLERECERMARCLAALGPIDLDDPAAWDLRLRDEERDEARRLLAPAGGRPLLAINMGGKLAKNDWGAGRWQALAAALARSHGDHALLVVGGPEDAPRAADLAARWPSPVVDACGRASPRVSAAALSQARCFVGHDSGPLHLAASVGVACVGLYGDHHEPRKWHPRGPRHRILHDMRGVQAITVEQVVHAVRSLEPCAEAPRPPVPETLP